MPQQFTGLVNKCFAPRVLPPQVYCPAGVLPLSPTTVRAGRLAEGQGPIAAILGRTYFRARA